MFLYLGTFAIYVNQVKKLYFKNRNTYIVNFVLNTTGNPKFIYDFCINIGSRINSFHVITTFVKLHMGK